MPNDIHSPELTPAPASEPPPAPAPVRINSIDQLKGLCAESVMARFVIDGLPVEVPCRRLTSREEAVIQAIEREVQPKLVKGATGKPEDDRYDYLDPKYIERRHQAGLTVRAMTIYTGCTLVAAGHPGLTDRQAITDYVETTFPNHILQIIYLTIVGGGLEVGERVNFFSGRGSPLN